MGHATHDTDPVRPWPTRARALAATHRAILVGVGGLIAACAVLLRRLAPDVEGTPLHPDEAVAGLVAARPLPEMLDTILTERGGPPFHYLAAHVALLVEPSAEALRWTSVAFALGTVVVCFDLGRRIAGPTAGATAALVAGTSTMLGQLGTFGRMYAAFAFTAALAVDLFYRALEQRSTRAAVVAALAAIVATATHTYGLFILLAEAGAALALWRGRPLRAAVPVLAAGVLLLPILFAYTRLSDRFSVGVGEGSSLASPRVAARQLHYTLAGISGGRLVVFGFAALAVVGTVAIARRQPAFLALWAAVLAPPALYLLLSGHQNVALYPRHMIFVLPFWAALIGAGFAHLTGRFPLAIQALLLGAVGLVAAGFSATTVGDPRRAGPFAVDARSDQALDSPVAWLRANVKENDVLYQYSTPALAALEHTQHATTVGPGPGRLLSRGLERVDYPVSGVVASLPVPAAELDAVFLGTQLGERADMLLTSRWLLVRQPGPFEDEQALLVELERTLRTVGESVVVAPPHVQERLESPLNAVCQALVATGNEALECRR